MSKSHFYGRVAPEANFSEFLSALLRPTRRAYNCISYRARAAYPRSAPEKITAAFGHVGRLLLWRASRQAWWRTDGLVDGWTDGDVIIYYVLRTFTAAQRRR